MFDLSGVRDGTGRRITQADLEWTIANIPTDDRLEFYAYPIESGWDDVQVSRGNEEITYGENPCGYWNLEPVDLQRIGGKVRMNVWSQVSKWLAAPGGNHGILVRCEGLDPELASGQAVNCELVVRYGFRIPEEGQ
jgi:hypothetical protein